MAVVVLALALAACGKLTMENFNRVKVGMSFDEVTNLIGRPERCSEALTVRTCEWGDDKRRAGVSFVSDKVILMSADNLR